ncbi:CvfD/Ygs/GSP13 family RNA-binding post-transcriptional regulator [Lacticaseibacillus zhaodongensis]|uniref:CvfD/Ygs/GSP13 family RNA-binding post-transcriptional regulator n=1 Tax=Lacticaseibacillus zhaodongensis TaxID=2668065 RepID=UPI0012D32C23|nr:CvfD/Ygs/GSP13 family RNA-binding post-transcriptional regulator [Lacticaseibacillus zhaodongensis]
MDYRIGDIVTGRVTGIQPYGVFVALDDEEQGLIHISECQHGFVKGINDLFHLEQSVQVIILDIDEYSHRISLSVRALQAPPALSPKRRRKHYWTTRKLHTGFAPIAERLAGWVTDYSRGDEK